MPFTMRLCLSLGILMLVGCQPSEVSFATARSQPIQFSKWRGQWVFVNYWADWCKPCYKELPELERFYQKHHLKGAQLVGVSFEAKPQTFLQKFAQKQHLHYPLLLTNPAEALGISDVNALPATAVIDPKGHFVRMLYGPQTVQSLEAVMH